MKTMGRHLVKSGPGYLSGICLQMSPKLLGRQFHIFRLIIHHTPLCISLNAAATTLAAGSWSLQEATLFLCHYIKTVKKTNNPLLRERVVIGHIIVISHCYTSPLPPESMLSNG